MHVTALSFTGSRCRGGGVLPQRNGGDGRCVWWRVVCVVVMEGACGVCGGVTRGGVGHNKPTKDGTDTMET